MQELDVPEKLCKVHVMLTSSLESRPHPQSHIGPILQPNLFFNHHSRFRCYSWQREAKVHHQGCVHSFKIGLVN